MGFGVAEGLTVSEGVPAGELAGVVASGVAVTSGGGRYFGSLGRLGC